MKVNAILETVLYAENLPAAESFYADVLGLKPFSKVTDRHLFYFCGHGVLLIFNPTESATQDIEVNGGVVPPHGASGSGHLCFSVKNAEIPAWRQWFHQKGVEIESEVTWDNGAQSIYFRDPAGNCLEVASPKLWELPEE